MKGFSVSRDIAVIVLVAGLRLASRQERGQRIQIRGPRSEPTQGVGESAATMPEIGTRRAGYRPAGPL